VVALPQATDPEQFYPEPGGPAHELLFVGNSRRVRRQILDDLLPTDRDLAVYGSGWTPDLLDPSHLRGPQVPNNELRRWYAGAAIVLNDHWPDMREHGFLSNRLYDALAAGAFVISDDVPGIAEAFDGAVVTYTDRAGLHDAVEHYLAHPAERRALAERGRAAVLARHAFAHRADTLLAALEPLLAARAKGGRGSYSR
jgi:spore maturation protein CgeB